MGTKGAEGEGKEEFSRKMRKQRKKGGEDKGGKEKKGGGGGRGSTHKSSHTESKLKCAGKGNKVHGWKGRKTRTST